MLIAWWPAEVLNNGFGSAPATSGGGRHLPGSRPSSVEMPPLPGQPSPPQLWATFLCLCPCLLPRTEETGSGPTWADSGEAKVTVTSTLRPFSQVLRSLFVLPRPLFSVAEPWGFKPRLPRKHQVMQGPRQSCPLPAPWSPPLEMPNLHFCPDGSPCPESSCSALEWHLTRFPAHLGGSCVITQPLLTCRVSGVRWGLAGVGWGAGVVPVSRAGSRARSGLSLRAMERLRSCVPGISPRWGPWDRLEEGWGEARWEGVS